MIDAHCHLDLYRDPYQEGVRVCGDGNIVIAVTTRPAYFRQGLPFIRGLRTIRLALGLHPLLATHTFEELREFEQLAPTATYIGEVGLDFSAEGKRTRTRQIASLRRILAAISDRPRYLSLHSRKAELPVLELLSEAQIERAVFHWFTGSIKDLTEVAASGHYFSVNPAMVRSQSGRSLIAAMPSDRVLTETDGPFVRIGKDPVAPAEVGTVAAFLATVWQLSVSEVQLRIERNFRNTLPPGKSL